MRTHNPVLTNQVFTQARNYGQSAQMTVQGTVNKTFILLFLALGTAGFVWGKAMQPIGVFQDGGVVNPIQAVIPWMIGGGIGGFVAAMVTIFKRDWVQYTAPAYALCEGLFLGGISAILERQYPGIVIQAVGLTFGTLFSLLLVYKAGFIKVTDNFRKGLFAATGAICLFYLVGFVLSFFKIQMPLIHSSGMFGIGFSLFVVGVAALNLVLDFDFIERGAEAGVDKKMEWFGAFGLMVTLVWLYVEILRLLSKLRDRR